MKTLLTIIMAGALIFSPVTSSAQRNRQSNDSRIPVVKAEPKSDSTKKAPQGPVSIEKFITKEASKMVGMTTVYKQDGKYYLTISDSLIGRDILMVSRVSQSAADIRGSFSGYAGDQIGSGLYRFEKGPDNRIFLRKVSVRERSQDSIMSMNILKSNLAPIIGSFPIKAWNDDKSLSIIDVTDFFNADSEELYFSKRTKTSFKLGAQDKDKSYISSIRTYPINTEVTVVKTFARTTGGNATYELNCSFVLLPEEPMTPRYYDERVGYFTTSYTDFDKNPHGVERVQLITRWRLEPRPEDLEKYKRGELVEPAKPIVYYIDPSTPAKWIPYLIQGVNDWEPVFRNAGFKNAIRAEMAPTPEQDSTWSLEDARYSAIVYKPSDIANASGPHVNDPRSGEIIESHINWYHNVMSLLHDWYFIQCSPVDEGARTMNFDDELMGQLVRFVSSHEVGHTLGLRHNFVGSAIATTKQLRDPEYLKKYGHTTSIMDYSRFNFVVQPGDNIPRELLFPRISTYDNWAIEWGYRRFYEYDDPKKELTMLNKWVIEKTSDPLYFFGTESSPNDPRYQSEDLGNNQMETCELGIRNLKYVTDNLIEWTAEPNKDYEALRNMHNQVFSQYRRYIRHVAKWVGGVYENPKRVEMEGDVYTPVEKTKQKEAMAFLNKQIFNPPAWLVPGDIINKVVTKPEIIMDNAYKAVFGDLLSKRVMLNLYEAELQYGNKAYTMTDLFADLNKYMWDSPMPKEASAKAYKRMGQKVYVTLLCGLFTGETAIRATDTTKDHTDINSMAYYQLKNLRYKLSIKNSTDPLESAHNDYLVKVIDKAFKKVFEETSKPKAEE